MHQYILVELSKKRSYHNACIMWQLTWYDLNTGSLAEMSVDSSYRNFRAAGWDHLVVSQCPWGVYEGLLTTDRHTRTGIPVLSADSVYSLIYRCKDHQEALKLVELDQQERTEPNHFNNLYHYAT